ncbi:uncharacterized protein EV422DRAFT_213045 [Fimicolochytrium jonesii]|uniref:uncharacterized protein n=1 Tax=Fimicolochytrium jonesii TaxID=1396493 RepID=UPI0022FEFAE7|nr:uncharacterized protein EV422DRAFT_213045 [Fimicolochytrium jonesii]KAI8817706.1 hypothetical protein EV422DRAFT_213045 [Fimicolochytrium jonesii]
MNSGSARKLSRPGFISSLLICIPTLSLTSFRVNESGKADSPGEARLCKGDEDYNNRTLQPCKRQRMSALIAASCKIDVISKHIVDDDGIDAMAFLYAHIVRVGIRGAAGSEDEPRLFDSFNECWRFHLFAR